MLGMKIWALEQSFFAPIPDISASTQSGPEYLSGGNVQHFLQQSGILKSPFPGFVVILVCGLFFVVLFFCYRKFFMFLCGRQIKKSREVRSFVNGGLKQEVKARQKQRTLHDAVGVSLWK
jgi:hypothetical protein